MATNGSTPITAVRLHPQLSEILGKKDDTQTILSVSPNLPIILNSSDGANISDVVIRDQNNSIIEMSVVIDGDEATIQSNNIIPNITVTLIK